MRSFLTVAVSLACIQAISAVPVYNLGGDKLHAPLAWGLVVVPPLLLAECLYLPAALAFLDRWSVAAHALAWEEPEWAAAEWQDQPEVPLVHRVVPAEGVATLSVSRSRNPSGNLRARSSRTTTAHILTKRLRDTDGRNETSKLNLKFFI
ncbi:hypothetical protein PCANC_18229 [Puccinia coronata f. sp. avenae]|uniref:Uncharacterized protein n=1 Tax=Puccinia coronata f. sp. avenae TaxID=200324 RepID=A0A2N5SLJ5_9BASI|nr:hypothetical protein PCANC_18229 [Puccinia coronata f. sp. avenae]